MPPSLAPHDIGFSDPMTHLLGCHADIRRFSGLMLRLDIHLIHYGPDDTARSTAHDILAYFEQEVPLHHADERGDLFPTLRRLGDADIVQSLDALDAEHESLMRTWRAVRAWLQGVRDRRPSKRPDLLGKFAARYPAYADREEREVFGAILRLPRDQLLSLADGMRRRRTLRGAG